jgi:hypothetical protein
VDAWARQIGLDRRSQWNILSGMLDMAVPAQGGAGSSGLPVDATPERGGKRRVRVAARGSAVGSPAKAGASAPRCDAQTRQNPRNPDGQTARSARSQRWLLLGISQQTEVVW